MAVQASKSISLTVSATGSAIKLSANNIVSFTTSGSGSLVKYLNNQDNVVTVLFNESVSTINTAAVRTQAVTLTDASSTVRYIHSDKIIQLTAVTAGTSILYWNGGKAAPDVFEVSQTPSAINTAAGNTFAITTQPTSATPSRTLYINNLFIINVVSEAAGTLPTLTATYKIKLETVTPSTAGSGYTSAVAVFAGGGLGAVLPTGHITLSAGATTGLVIDTAGSNITDDVTVTVTGDGTGAAFVNKIHHILDTLVTTPGANLNTALTVVFGAGTITATATIQVSPTTQKATGTTITNVGSYLASAFPPTLTVTGGSGAQIKYDNKRSACVNIQVEETAATVQSAINAL